MFVVRKQVTLLVNLTLGDPSLSVRVPLSLISAHLPILLWTICIVSPLDCALRRGVCWPIVKELLSYLLLVNINHSMTKQSLQCL